MKSVSRTFRNKGAHALFILLACFSLVISSVGACLCPHHETRPEKAGLSCHSRSHGTEASESNADDNRLESLCICVRHSSPVVLNKSNKKKTDDQKHPIAPFDLPVFESAVHFVPNNSIAKTTWPFFQGDVHGLSAPSRAPPRL